MTSFNSFFEFSKFESYGSSFQVKKLALLQVDIAGHSKMSKDFAADKVMEVKVKLAESLVADLSTLGFGGVFWAGDGGMFMIEVTHNRDTVALIDAWRRITTLLGGINQQYRSFFANHDIQLRVSAHIADVLVHTHPRYWHSEELNFFAKHERDIGEIDTFRVTGAVFDMLPHEQRQLFQKTATSIDENRAHLVYEYSSELERTGSDFSNQMRQIAPVIKSVVEGSRAYREGIRQAKGTPKDGKGDILFVVDVQKDFCDPTSEHLSHLYVEQTESLVSSLNALIAQAEIKGIPIIFTRDWHPDKHPSFLDNKGVWREHCVAGTEGAAFHERLEVPENSHIVNIGASIKGRDYTPFLDDSLLQIINVLRPKRMLVTGIALEYCVLATCLDGLAHVEEVAILEEYVRAADLTSGIIQIVWDALEQDGVKRIKTFPLHAWE
ncbi:MAG TPA: isochorismatase family protein [Pyrinomonadaceae bacterium]|jgi:nicotinamidase/pyrazinamidase